MKLNRNLSIKKLTLIIFSIMYTIFFIITSINLYSYSKYEFSKTEKLIKNYNISLSQQLTEKINNISNVSKYPLLIPEIDNLHSILSANKSFSISDYNYLTYLCEMMLIQNDSINGAYLYDLKGRGVFSTRNSANDKLKNPTTEKWFLDALTSSETTTLISNINSNNIFEITSTNDEHSIAIARKIIDIKTQKLNGLVLVTLPLKDLENLLKKDLPFTNQGTSIFDSNGNCILNTAENKFIPSANEIKYYLYLPTLKYTNTNPDYIISYNKIPTTNWALVTSIPKSDAYHIDTLYIIFFITNIVFYLILFIVLFFFFLKRIFNPIKSLIQNMEGNIELNLGFEFNYNSNDEIGILVKSYNEMKNRINHLITINYKNKIEQKELDLRQLQNQINPHFIYNTLESIHMMAEINDDLETSTMAEYFGSIIRYSMNRKVNTVLLKDEIRIIDNYIYLQRIRFDQLFNIENLIEPEVLNCEIIKMIIQPLIENSIYHGLSECNGDGKIIIQGQHINDNLLLTVSDNGTGIDDIILKDLNDYINDKNSKFKGIALRNINKRLKLNYGDEYGLEIFSVLGKGTSMTLTLPYIVEF
ncbi:histidine kinase [Clostridium sp. SHJSY1]|uniref:sensor histidine kinase n=1 Tax=Clostridium sp. SHJSY1 TaxID=2942483 RepID=UPI00287656E2|nr:histidine kinase [Clostridium sp. SHJSY1]MDS0524828.1 histidine kinase [Clostridium sp. SHJSY1]